MFGIIVLLECPATPKFQLLHRWHDVLSVFSYTHCRFRARGSKPDPKCHWAMPMPHCRQVFFSVYSSSFRHTADPLTLFLCSTEMNPQFSAAYFYGFEHTGADLFWFSSGVQAWGPSAFSLSLTVQTQTSVSAATKPCFMSFIVTRRFLICLLRNMVTAVESFFFLPHPGSITAVVLTLNLQSVDCCCYFISF